MEITKDLSMGFVCDKCTHESCTAIVAIGDEWATIYSIESKTEDKGHASELLVEMKKHYEALGKEFGSTVALNKKMRYLLEKFQIKEYHEY